ncbi:hypothetical protein CVS40_1178 [Lucilia cuprina]|nr:hypothetical protein CVS40_1178 [Lucilia cuprina]
MQFHKPQIKIGENVGHLLKKAVASENERDCEEVISYMQLPALTERRRRVVSKTIMIVNNVSLSTLFGGEGY